MTALYTDWKYLQHRIALQYGEVCFEIENKFYSLGPTQSIEIDLNNQIAFIHNVDVWLKITSSNGEFNPSDTELQNNVCEHTGKTKIENLQPAVSGIVGNISLIVVTIKKNTK